MQNYPPGYGQQGGYPQQPQQGYPQQQQQGYAQGQYQQQPGAMVQAPQAGMLPPNLMAPQFLVVRPWLSLMGRKFWVYGPGNALVAFVKHPLLKLRPEFTIFADESETVPFLHVKARTVIGFNICHDCFDPQSGARVGSLRRQGLKSMFKDTWDLLDANDQVVGLMTEDSMSLVRRIFPIIPGKWHVELGGQVVAKINQQFTFFSKKFDLDVSMGQGRLDPRFAIACAISALFQEMTRQG